MLRKHVIFPFSSIHVFCELHLFAEYYICFSKYYMFGVSSVYSNIKPNVHQLLILSYSNHDPMLKMIHNLQKQVSSIIVTRDPDRI